MCPAFPFFKKLVPLESGVSVPAAHHNLAGGPPVMAKHDLCGTFCHTGNSDGEEERWKRSPPAVQAWAWPCPHQDQSQELGGVHRGGGGEKGSQLSKKQCTRITADLAEFWLVSFSFPFSVGIIVPFVYVLRPG